VGLYIGVTRPDVIWLDSDFECSQVDLSQLEKSWLRPTWKNWHKVDFKATSTIPINEEIQTVGRNHARFSRPMWYWMYSKKDKHDRMLIDLLWSKSRITRISKYPFGLIACVEKITQPGQSAAPAGGRPVRPHHLAPPRAATGASSYNADINTYTSCDSVRSRFRKVIASQLSVDLSKNPSKQTRRHTDVWEQTCRKVYYVIALLHTDHIWALKRCSMIKRYTNSRYFTLFQGRINHCAGCTMGGGPCRHGAPDQLPNFLPRCFDVWTA